VTVGKPVNVATGDGVIVAPAGELNNGQEHEASLMYMYVVGRVNQGIRREMRARLAQATGA